MEQFILPTTFAWKDGTKPNEKLVVIEPCYFGYGTTLGNALRRVLLSSLTGAAATAVKIDGVSHEFSAVPGVREDAIEILLNVKQLRLKVFSDEPVRLVVQARGKREVTAADIARDAQVEIVNPELHLASLTSDDAEFRMEIFARRGRGYSSTDSRPKEKQELGTMAIDAIFAPIRNVGFRVENMRVGEITNYDRLLLTVETDGTLTPEYAVQQAGQMLIDHFSLIVHPPTEESGAGNDAAASSAALPEHGADPTEDTGTNS